MSTSNPEQLLPSLLQDQLIPWSADHPQQRMIVARPQMDAAQLPEEMSMEQRKLRGKRHVTRGERMYGNTRMVSAEWVDESLIELAVPKLVCVVNGFADYQVGEYLLSCNAGHFIFIPPNTPHPDGRRAHLEGSREKEGFCELLQVISFRRGLQCLICRSQGAEHAHVKGENYLIRNEEANRLFDLMMEEAVSDKENHRLICGNLLATFMLLLQREINAGHYLLPGPRVPRESFASSSNDFLTELDRYVLAHLGEKLTLEGVARQMYFSRSQFAIRVRQETGQTFIDYVTDRRLAEARTLLRESEWTTITISKFVGFKSSAYFHRLFQKKMGMTPGAYRSQTGEKSEAGS